MTTIVVAGSFGFCKTALAEEMDNLAESDKFSLSLGAYAIRRSSSTIRLDTNVAGPLNIGTTLDWERDLHGDTATTVPRLDGYYRFTRKSRVDFSWYYLSREGEVVLKNDIDFGNIHLAAGQGIRSELDTAITKISYTYAFYRAPEIETSLSGGIHVSRTDVSIETTSGMASESTHVTAPLPVVGLRLNYNLNPKWQVNSKYELFFLDDVDKYSGSLTDFVLSLEHHTFKHLKFGIGFNRVETNLTSATANSTLQVRNLLSGYLFYTSLTY